MATRRKTYDPNALGIQVPIHGFGAHRADRSLSIEQGHKAMTTWESILQDDPSDAVLDQPSRNSMAFGPDNQSPVPSAGADQHTGPIGLRGARTMHGYIGLVGLKGAITHWGIV
jgi:hypothetical protein